MPDIKTKNSKFLSAYRDKSVKIIMQAHPDWDKEVVKSQAEKMIESMVRNPEVRLENNYTHEERDSSLLAVFDYAMDRKPIIAGNGTFYKQHREAPNLNATMLIGFLDQRAAIKKEMFAIEDESSPLYARKDLSQNNKKKLANSYYGGSGMKASAFYNKFSGPAVTKSAQSVISTCMTTFEAFLTSAFTFVDINEAFYWIETVLKEEDNKVDKWVKRISLEKVHERLSNNVIGITDAESDILYNYLSNLSEDDWTRLYWKNNLIEFIDTHQEIKDLNDLIFASVKNYEYMKDADDFGVVDEQYLERVKNAKDLQKEWANIVDLNYFYDPNHAPDTIKPYLEKMKDLYMKYVYVQFLYTDRIYKLKNFKRNVVTVIDTDSNILSLDTYMEYCLNNLKRGDYGRSEWNNVFIAINTITYAITAAVTDILLFYGKMSNVAPEYRGRYEMKNEFFFSNLVIAKVKKRYLSKVLLREGHKLKKPKYDTKGFDFKKASTSEDASKFFAKVVEEQILEPKDVDIKKLMMTLQEFREEVRQSVMRGERKYLPMGNAKEMDGYDDPDREQSVRGACAWNIIYPSKSVEFPVKLSILKLNIFKLEDIASLKNKEPEVYQRIKEGIFEDKTGMFVKRNSKTGKVEYRGLAVLGIPLHEQIPDWAIPYVDYTTVVNSVLAPFKSVTETFNLPSIEEGKTGRKSTGFTNIIRI